MRAAFSHYSCDVGPHHPFPMAKYREVHACLTDDGTLAPEEILPATAATEEELRRVHSADYVERFISGALTPQEERRLGFRWTPDLCRRALHATGGSVAAARAALKEGIAANLAGGSHHAFAGHGEGYCAFHDMAVAIQALRAEGPSRRVAIVDCDVHQGNGSAALFAGDPEVFTFSVHCESNYPRQKIPGSRDLALRDGVEDVEYLALLDVELEAVWNDFRPQMVFFQAGVDPLRGDRLGRLALSREGLRRRDECVIRRCLSSDIPLLILLGGGYGATLEETVQAHADTIRTACRLSALPATSPARSTPRP
jgi:acetoin utilization deacetylase AcuC-like enzyme